jgi:hypothetical protein
MKKAIEYRVSLEDGSGNTFIAENKTDARQQMNTYLRDVCGFGGRYGGKLPRIESITAEAPTSAPAPRYNGFRDLSSFSAPCPACAFETWATAASAEDLEAAQPPVYRHTCGGK